LIFLGSKVQRGFTLIEILVSVVLISTVILGILKIRQHNSAIIEYLDRRVESELADSLFLERPFHESVSKLDNALKLLSHLRVTNPKTRELLRQQHRYIQIGDPLLLTFDLGVITLESILLRTRYIGRYYRLSF